MQQGGLDALKDEHPGLFLRKSTGLVRELGARDSIWVNMGVANPGIGFILLLPILAVYLQADFTLPFVIGAIGCFFLALTYAQLVAVMPRTGGDYVFASRVFGPVMGAVIGGALLLMFCNFAGSNIAVLSQVNFPFLFQGLGTMLHSSLVTGWAGDVSQKVPEAIVGIVVMAIVAVIATRGLRTMSRALFVCFAVGMVWYAVLVFLYATHSQAGFQAAFNANAGHVGAYGAVVSQAKSLGLSTGTTLAGSLAIIPFIFMLYGGFTWSVYPAGEVKRPMRTTLIATVAALVISLVMYVAAWRGLTGMAGLNFLQSATWLSANHPSVYGAITSAPVTPAFYALLVSADPVTKFILAIGGVFWNFAIRLAYVHVLPRIIFALAFDRVIPTAMADVRQGTGTPVKAIVAAAIGILVFGLLSILTSFITEFRNSVIVLELVFTVSSLACMVVPWVRRADFEAAPKVLGGRWFGLPAVSVIAAVSFIVNLAVLIVAVVSPQISGGYDVVSVVVVLVMVLWGVVAYFVSKTVMRSRGVDLALAMRELPPE